MLCSKYPEKVFLFDEDSLELEERTGGLQSGEEEVPGGTNSAPFLVTTVYTLQGYIC